MDMGEIYGYLNGAWKTLGRNAAGLGKRGCNSARLFSYLKSSEFDWNGHGRILREIGRGLEDIGRECGGAGQEGM